MKRFTLDQIMSWGPCQPPYTRAFVKKLMGRKKTFTARDLMALDIPDKDKHWCLLRPEVIGEKNCHILACRMAERDLRRERKAGREPHKDSRNAIKVKRAWIRGKASDEELAVARAAAWAAAWAAAGAVAWAAARETAWEAVRETAAVALAAAARAEEVKWQLKQAYKMVL